MLHEGGHLNQEKHGVLVETKKARKTQVEGKKTAYEVRKEHKRNLEVQVEKMQKELDNLKFRLLVEQGEVEKVTKRAEAENSVLRDFIQEQHLKLAATQAAWASHAVRESEICCLLILETDKAFSYSPSQQRSLNTLQPVQSVIRLGSDPAERYNTLMALKEHQLDNAERYLAARSRGLDAASSYCQEERFDAPEGDYCVVRFDSAPMRGANTKEVFDAILSLVLNAEIFLSEMFGCVAIREDNDFETSEFAQLRLVTSTSPGATVESNTVLFSRFVEETDNEEGSYGVMAADFVDFDALHPYRTGERVRRDATTLVKARSISTKDDKSPEVVITRWTCLKIHRNSRSISQDPERELAESSVCWGDTAKTCIQQQLVHPTTIDPLVS